MNAQAPVTFMGVATSTGEHMTWTDAGQPMFCIDQKDYVEERSAIDPSIFMIHLFSPISCSRRKLKILLKD